MVNQRIKEITLITIGSLLFAIGINYFAIPNRLSEGGIIGLTVVTYYLFDWSRDCELCYKCNFTSYWL